MPRSNWKGFITFGLVNIPIILYNTENKTESVSFHQIDRRNNARIRYARVNSETGEEVPWEEVGKAYDYSKDNLLIVEEGDLKKVVGDNARNIAIENFVDKDSINFIDINKTYYLLPDKKGEKGYVILREALKDTKKIGIAKVIISTKEYIGAIANYKGALVLYLLRYQHEIKPLSEFDFPSENLKEHKVTVKEIDIAKQLIKSMSAKWKPEKYKDEYQEAVHQWAKEKIKQKPVSKMASRSKGASLPKTADFIDLLKKSLKVGSVAKEKKVLPIRTNHRKQSYKHHSAH